MRKAFTLIELLVVIAIIAILAAILFPVFAQAKQAAKKTVSLSNQKQIGLAVVMYASDHDDLYPRNDGCTLNSSMVDKYNVQPPGTDPTPWCNGSKNPGDFAFRDNHYAWQKWVQPYMKNKQLFTHPVIQTIYGTSADHHDMGEIASGYALNLALTGALNTWPNFANVAAIRNSFIGGTVTSIPSPGEAMIVMEQPFYAIIGAYEYPPTGQTTTYYPMAIREHFKAIFYTQGGTGMCGETTEIDKKSVPFANNVPLSFADGHTKVMQVGQFLANTPSYTEYGVPWSSFYCSMAAAWWNNGDTRPPQWTKPWPMWGLQ